MCASAEYAEEIHAHWREVEEGMWPRQSFVDERRRSILLDWLVGVHAVAKFAPETLYLAVLLIDSYLGLSTPVNMDNLQLMGTAALVIAAKFEEIEPEGGFDFGRFYDGIYSRQHVLDMERSMLSALEYRVAVPTVFHFMLRYLTVALRDIAERIQTRVVQTACYIAERCSIEYRMLTKHRPSMVACGAIYAALHTHGAGDEITPWTPALEAYTRYSRAALRECVRDIVIIFKKAPLDHESWLFKKYNHKKFGAVAGLTLEVRVPRLRGRKKRRRVKRK